MDNKFKIGQYAILGDRNIYFDVGRRKSVMGIFKSNIGKIVNETTNSICLQNNEGNSYWFNKDQIIGVCEYSEYLKLLYED